MKALERLPDIEVRTDKRMFCLSLCVNMASSGHFLSKSHSM